MKKLLVVLLLSVLALAGACATAPAAGQSRYGIGVELYVDVPASTTTPSAAPTQTAPTTQAHVPTPAPQSTPSPAAWNCDDHSNVIIGFAHPVVCANPAANSFKLLVTNARIISATVAQGNFRYTPIRVILEKNQDGCIHSSGCLYTIKVFPAGAQNPDEGTFQSLAHGQGLELYPETPEIGKQGVQVWFKMVFEPGTHKVYIEP